MLEALPRMAKAAESLDLQAPFTKHLGEAEGHVQRLWKNLSLRAYLDPTTTLRPAKPGQPRLTVK